MLDCEHLAGLRREWLFELAHLCHCPPPVVDALSLGDFAVMIERADQHIKATAQQAG